MKKGFRKVLASFLALAMFLTVAPMTFSASATDIEQEKAAHPTWTDAQVRDLVLTYSAAPGTSEHHTGNAIDLISTNYVSLDETFAQNPAYEWLQQNAHRFGFILRYPADKTDITGYSYEPWHYRFVCADAATEIH